MQIIGRKEEQEIIEECLRSGRPEFLVVYGRRRVGKTYLIKEFFNRSFAFYATGVPNQKTAQQLKFFHQSLLEYGSTETTAPSDWLEAFMRLRHLLEDEGAARDPVSGKLVVFLDELPWMDTARSDFRSALDYFWNSWGSSKQDLLLIVCGSASSWIIRHILADTGGLYNRVTRTIHLAPFTLRECEELFHMNGIEMSRTQILESYMIFGGIPYYLGYYNRRYSLAQNIDALYFRENGPLHYEYERLFQSLFRNAEKHIAIVDTLSKKKFGMTRTEIAGATRINDGGASLTAVLSELSQCGFIRKYQDYTRAKNGARYQLTDPFLLFNAYVRSKQNLPSWTAFTGTAGYHAWCGLSYELVCLLHTPQIKQTLGIAGVDSSEFAWRSTSSHRGAQIDLLIDRMDNVINLCEMKYSQGEYRMTASDEKSMLNKKAAFVEETKTKKSVHLTMVAANGLARNPYAGIFQSVITGADLFQ